MDGALQDARNSMTMESGSFRDWVSSPPGTPLPKTITMEEWRVWGVNLASARTAIDWKSVDWIMHAEKYWPETYHQFAEDTGLSTDYLRRIAWIGASFQDIRARVNIDDVPITICSEFASSDYTDEHKMNLIEDYRKKPYSRAEWRLYVRHYKFNVLQSISGGTVCRTNDTVQEESPHEVSLQPADIHRAIELDAGMIRGPEMLSIRVSRDAYNALFRFMDRMGITDMSEGIIKACAHG